MRARLALHVHQADRRAACRAPPRARPRARSALHVVDHPGAGGAARRASLPGFDGVDRNRRTSSSRAQRLDHREHASQFLARRTGAGAGPRRFAADVEIVGALVRPSVSAVRQRRVARRRSAPPSEKESGVTLSDAHDARRGRGRACGRGSCSCIRSNMAVIRCRSRPRQTDARRPGFWATLRRLSAAGSPAWSACRRPPGCRPALALDAAAGSAQLSGGPGPRPSMMRVDLRARRWSRTSSAPRPSMCSLSRFSVRILLGARVGLGRGSRALPRRSCARCRRRRSCAASPNGRGTLRSSSSA